jgi:hypothetical protein
MLAFRPLLGRRIVAKMEHHLIIRLKINIDPVDAALTCDEHIMSLAGPVTDVHLLIVTALHTHNAIVCEKYRDQVHVDFRLSGRPDIIRLGEPGPLVDFLLGTLQGNYNTSLFQGGPTDQDAITAAFAASHLACSRDDKKLIKMVPKWFAGLDNGTVMSLALTNHSIKVAKYLLTIPSTDIWEISAASGFVEFIRYMAASWPVPPLPMGLGCAAYSGDLQTVQLMYDHGARDLGNALEIACRHYHLAVVDLLFTLGAEYCANCKGCLHLTAEESAMLSELKDFC